MSVLHRSQQFTSFDWHKGDPQALYKGVSRSQDGGCIGGLREPECWGRGRGGRVGLLEPSAAERPMRAVTSPCEREARTGNAKPGLSVIGADEDKLVQVMQRSVPGVS